MKKRKLKIRRILLLFILITGVLVLIFTLPNKEKVVEKSKKKVKKEIKQKVGEKPEIKLLGRNDYKIVKNGVYEEMGAVASDKEDGDISKNIKIENNIKVEKPGEYNVIYSVKDKDGNESTIERKVTVFEVEDKDTDGIAVLMYHYFYDDTAGEKGENSNYLKKSLFEEELKYLSENDYYIPSMKEINLYVEGKLDLPKKSLVLTLDDGEASNYSIAYPLAVKYKIPIVMFVVTSWTDLNESLQTEMKNTGYVIFQSHTNNMHRSGCSGEQHGAIIQCINHDEGVADLVESKNKIGNADSLAYPCGDENDNARSIMKDAGFSLGFTTRYGKVNVGDNKLSLPRVRINDGISLQNYINSI